MDLEKVVLESIKELEKQTLNNIPKIENNKGKIAVIGWGKACDLIIQELYKTIPKNELVGIRYVSNKPNLKKGKLVRYNATHPFISKKNFIATKKIIDFVETLEEEDLLVVVSTGGGSAMFEYSSYPASKVEELNKKLVLSNKNIKEINRERKKYSIVKGGKLLKFIPCKNILNLVVSDIVTERKHNAVKYVASGPTSGYQRGIKIKSKILAENEDLLKIISKNIKKNKIQTVIRKKPYFNETKKVAKKTYNEFLKVTKKKRGDVAYICGGEPYVNLVKNSGRGGRCTQLAAEISMNLEEDCFSVICISTDGKDFLDCCSGAYVTNEKFEKINILNAKDLIRRNNTLIFHKKIGSLINGFDSETNVCDILVFITI